MPGGLDALEYQRVKGFEPRSSAVLGLHGARGPPNVAREVSFIVLDAIERMPLWARAEMLVHVVSERYKIIDPFGGYRDASAAPVFESYSFWIEAPSFHFDPTNVHRRPVVANCVSMAEIPGSGSLCCLFAV
jgi:hypothetical protein